MGIKLSDAETQKLEAVRRALVDNKLNIEDMRLFGCDIWYPQHRDGKTARVAMWDFLTGLIARVDNDVIDFGISDQALFAQSGKN